MSSDIFLGSVMVSSNMALEELLYRDGSGANRACLGRGQLHWYKLCCKADKERQAVAELQAYGMTAVLPQRRVKSVSPAGRDSWKKVKYEQGAAVLVLCRLEMHHVVAAEGMKYLSHEPSCWFHSVGYTSLRTNETLILPRPMTAEELKEVADFESLPGSNRKATDFEEREAVRLQASGHYVPPV